MLAAEPRRRSASGGPAWRLWRGAPALRGGARAPARPAARRGRQTGAPALRSRGATHPPALLERALEDRAPARAGENCSRDRPRKRWRDQNCERQGAAGTRGSVCDPLHLQLADRKPSPEERAALEGLASHYRSEQLLLIGELAERFGEGPALRNARERIEAGELLGAADSSWLKQKAEEDQRSRAEQQRLRGAYLGRREAGGQAAGEGPGPRGTPSQGAGGFPRGDRSELPSPLPDCEETAYPDPETDGELRKAPSRRALPLLRQRGPRRDREPKAALMAGREDKISERRQGRAASPERRAKNPRIEITPSPLNTASSAATWRRFVRTVRPPTRRRSSRRSATPPTALRS